jgi:hypothetical protein
MGFPFRDNLPSIRATATIQVRDACAHVLASHAVEAELPGRPREVFSDNVGGRAREHLCDARAGWDVIVGAVREQSRNATTVVLHGPRVAPKLDEATRKSKKARQNGAQQVIGTIVLSQRVRRETVTEEELDGVGLPEY